MSAAPPGQELCPHCHKPFKRLRSHLPYCKAAPSRAPGPAVSSAGSTDRAGPGAAGKSGKSPPSPSKGQGLPGEGTAAAAAEQGGGLGPGAQRAAEAAVQEVARALDLPPGEVQDAPGALRNGAEIVIEKHRGRVLRGKSGAGAAPRGPGPQEAVAGAGRTQAEPRGPGAAGKAPASSERGKGSLKAAKPPVLGAAPGANGGSGPGDLVLQEGTGKTGLEEKRGHPEAGVGQKAPVPALHSKNLHVSAAEALGGHSQGTSKPYLPSTHRLSESKQMVSAPILSAGRDAELALHQPVLHATQGHPICLPRAPGRSTQAGALGLEWFPDLRPNYDRLRIFAGKPFREDAGIAMKTPTGSFSEGQQGPLLERRLMDVRLGELPLWVTTRDVSPQVLLGGIQRAWNSYYNKYINVKKGGPAGVSMLLAGYCLLSYAWNYQHIKRYRWRKYH